MRVTLHNPTFFRDPDTIYFARAEEYNKINQRAAAERERDCYHSDLLRATLKPVGMK